jgi:hypothetical protein
VDKRQSGSEDAPPIKRVGFFHFATADSDDPIETLKTSLRNAQTLSLDSTTTEYERLDDCLLVLPEAFNLRGPYCSDIYAYPDQSIATSLVNISLKEKIAFVVGLIDDSADKALGRSSAYLIDSVHLLEGEGRKRLSCKMREDWSGKCRARYSVCSQASDTAVLHRGVCVAALICMDASNDPLPSNDVKKKRNEVALIDKRHQTLVDRIDKQPAVLCIPSRMRPTSSEIVATYWRNKLPSKTAIVVANATSTQPSVIMPDADQAPRYEHENKVCIVNFGPQTVL